MTKTCSDITTYPTHSLLQTFTNSVLKPEDKSYE